MQTSMRCAALKLVLIDPASGANVDSLYWRYETFLKECEGRLGALLGSNGSIYAIRRESFIPIPPQTIVDDFCIPLVIKQQTGCSIIYDSTAIAKEETAACSRGISPSRPHRCWRVSGDWHVVANARSASRMDRIHISVAQDHALALPVLSARHAPFDVAAPCFGTTSLNLSFGC